MSKVDQIQLRIREEPPLHGHNSLIIKNNFVAHLALILDGITIRIDH